MPRPLTPLLETNIQRDVAQWGVSATTCPALTQIGVRSVGICRPGRSYCVIRLNPNFGHLNICLSGTGRYLVNGAWRDIARGNAILSPRHQMHGAEFAGDEAWRMAWVVFSDAESRFPRLGSSEARVAPTDTPPWEWALSGLHRESQGLNDPGGMQTWAAVIHHLVHRLVQADERQARLAAVWERVSADLAHPWSAAELARLAGMSEVHLRRICLQALGRAPMQQVAWLRMRHASFLLQAAGQTVEGVAWTVGYASASAFTVAFKKWNARRPRD